MLVCRWFYSIFSRRFFELFRSLGLIFCLLIYNALFVYYCNCCEDPLCFCVDSTCALCCFRRHQPHSLQQPHLHNSYSFGGPAKSPFVPSPLVTSGTDDIASGGDHFSRLLTETKLTEPTNTISKSSSSHC